MIRGRLRPLQEFLATEQAGGAAMLAATIAALIWANLAHGSYRAFWSTPLTLPLPVLDHFTIGDWVGEGLMVLFFFVVGLEIKREVADGELSDPKAAALPVLAAIGGMAVPALVYVAATWGSGAERGWAIPTATDIAFVLGVLALLGPRAPAGVKLFLLSLAIADDIGGIVVIALFYSSGISFVWLGLAAAGCAAVLVLQRLGVARIWPYVPLGVWIWYSMLLSGVHPTIAGVVVGLLTPVGPFRGGDDFMARIEHRLHPVSSFVVVPAFALANAGVVVSAATLAAAATEQTSLGIFTGLVAGKAVGISLFAWMAVKTRLARLPSETGLGDLVAASPLGGIGFTVAIFIASLTFPAGPRLESALLAVLVASATAAALGALTLTVSARLREQAAAPP